MQIKMNREELLENFQTKIGYHFKDMRLLEEALTHASYANENGLAYNNERLEFLGDAVLELISSEIIYGMLSEVDEGQLTKVRSQLVCGQTMSDWAEKHGLAAILRTGKSVKGSVSKAMLENAGEAVFGAVFLDSDYETAKKAAKNYLLEQADHVSLNYVDSKTMLQEYVQSKYKGETPHYATIFRPEPDSGGLFKVAVFIGGKETAQGSGKNIKAAEFMAARNALDILKVRN